MQTGKFNLLCDQAFGSSGKGLMSTWLADHFNVTKVSSSNFPNAGHTAAFENGIKFVAKAIPTPAILKKAKGMNMECFLSPGSGFFWSQLIKEWEECGRPIINVHGRASIVTENHKKRELEGNESTKHLASTMQGTATAIVDKVLRRRECLLAFNDNYGLERVIEDFADSIRVTDPMQFRNYVWNLLENGNSFLHEVSQGYALSIDHGYQFPFCTSRNCTIQAAMDQMAIPPSMVGDIYLNLRTYPIRVGNVIENGVQQGYSGDFYPDSRELTWEEVGKRAGMPDEEMRILAERERTTVTKRIRRVSTFSYIGLKDAAKMNGVTKLCVNFIQYINWKDAGLHGGKEAFARLSSESRAFIESVENAVNLPVVLIGTGAMHHQMISLL